MELATKLVFFKFDKLCMRKSTEYLRGGRLGPLMANVFMEFLEQQVFVRVPKQYYCVFLFTLRNIKKLSMSELFLPLIRGNNNNILLFLDVLVDNFPSYLVNYCILKAYTYRVIY